MTRRDIRSLGFQDIRERSDIKKVDITEFRVYCLWTDSKEVSIEKDTTSDIKYHMTLNTIFSVAVDSPRFLCQHDGPQVLKQQRVSRKLEGWPASSVHAFITSCVQVLQDMHPSKSKRRPIFHAALEPFHT